MLRIERITKRFLKTVALQEITLPVRQGEIIGILGPNGAGKTTLFKIVTGILQPNGGRLVFGGNRQPRMGFKPERLFFPERMTFRQYLNLMARLGNIKPGERKTAVDEALLLLGLEGSGGRRIKEASKGMRQRLGLAQALLGDPDLLVLDEPTDGLDPAGQAEIYEIFRRLRAGGKTILMSSHRLGEITAVCTEIAILHRGRVIYQNRMSDALAERPKAVIHVDRPLTTLRPLLEMLHPQLQVGELTINLRGESIARRREILGIILAAGYDILQIERRRATLADIYAEVTRS